MGGLEDCKDFRIESAFRFEKLVAAGKDKPSLSIFRSFMHPNLAESTAPQCRKELPQENLHSSYSATLEGEIVQVRPWSMFAGFEEGPSGQCILAG